MATLGRIGSAASFFPLILAGLLAGLTFWLELATRPPVSGNDGKSRHDPDYIVENFEVRRFGPTGVLQHTLRATLMKHYPDDDSTVVTAPDLTYFRDPPTTVTARQALISSKGEHVQLIDDVIVTRSGIAGKPNSVLTTSRLDAYPDEEIATSDVPVTITKGLSKVNGSAMQANNKTAIYILEGPVRGIFHKDGGVSPATAMTTTPTAIPQTRAETPPVATKPPVKPAQKAVAKPKAKAKPNKAKPNTQPKSGSTPRR
jgi:lipopolysaccharide export system protein LptC